MREGVEYANDKKLDVVFQKLTLTKPMMGFNGVLFYTFCLIWILVNFLLKG